MRAFPGQGAVAGASRSCLFTAQEQHMELPGLWHGGPHQCQVSHPALPCVSPRGGGGRGGKEHPCPSPRLGSAASACVAPRPRGWCAPGLASLCTGSWILWVCVSNFKGMSHFLEKTDRLNKKQINTDEGEGFDRAFAVNFNQAAGSRSRSPSSQGSHCVRCRWETGAGIPWGCSGQEAAALTPLPACCLPAACGKGRCWASPWQPPSLVL